MIRMELSLACAGMLFLFLAGIFVVSFVRRAPKERKSLPAKGCVVQCRYCAHVFVDHSEGREVVCPVCHSYLEVIDALQKKK